MPRIFGSSLYSSSGDGGVFSVVTVNASGEESMLRQIHTMETILSHIGLGGTVVNLGITLTPGAEVRVRLGGDGPSGPKEWWQEVYSGD